mmetsp:Transcript_12674/g.21028  ORF Transcript_12674/g.21028 Transcript_12674/m.21028 type:complete len:244 (+) Transcript_12674:797-1528(+)
MNVASAPSTKSCKYPFASSSAPLASFNSGIKSSRLFFAAFEASDAASFSSFALFSAAINSSRFVSAAVNAALAASTDAARSCLAGSASLSLDCKVASAVVKDDFNCSIHVSSNPADRSSLGLSSTFTDASIREESNPNVLLAPTTFCTSSLFFSASAVPSNRGAKEFFSTSSREAFSSNILLYSLSPVSCSFFFELKAEVASLTSSLAFFTSSLALSNASLLSFKVVFELSRLLSRSDFAGAS